jgi:basic membrane protein A
MIAFRLSRSLVVLTALATALVGCGSPSASESGTSKAAAETGASTDKLTVGVVFDSGGRGDKSFNDSAYAGIERAQKEFELDVRTVDSKSIKDYETNLAALAEQGTQLVFAVGITQKEALEAVAPRFPNTKFAMIDAEIEAPNVRGIIFAEEQGSFLAGYAAALASKTGKIGFVGGMNIPLIRKFESGYIAGAKSAKPDIQVLPSKYTESWDNVSLGKQSALALFNAGADVVYHASGRCGLGVIDAAKEKNALAIGVDSNQDDVAPGFVLTSMLKRVDEAVYNTIKDMKAGTDIAGAKRYDLSTNGVGLTEMAHTKDRLPADALARIEEAREGIIAGTIVVPTTPEELEKFVASARS